MTIPFNSAEKNETNEMVMDIFFVLLAMIQIRSPALGKFENLRNQITRSYCLSPVEH